MTARFSETIEPIALPIDTVPDRSAMPVLSMLLGARSRIARALATSACSRAVCCLRFAASSVLSGAYVISGNVPGSSARSSLHA